MKNALSTNRITRHDLLILLLILSMAALMRVGDLAAGTHFRYDQGIHSINALDMASGKTFPLLGAESSAGLPVGPSIVYFLAIPYWISDSPQFATVFVGLWQVFGVGCLWYLAHRYFGRLVGFWAGLAYALNLYAVNYSRNIWSNYRTPFILLGFILGFRGFLEGKRWAQVLCLPVLLFGMQIHFAAYTLLTVYVWLLWVGRKNISWKALALSLLLGALVMLPFFIGLSQITDTTTSVFENVLNVLRYDLDLRLGPIENAIDLATGFGQEGLGMNARALLGELILRPDILWISLGLVTWLGFIVTWTQRWRHLAMLFVLWAVIPVLVFVPNWTGMSFQKHYLIQSIPSLSFLAGIGIAWLIKTVSSRVPHYRYLLQVVISGVFCAAILSHGYWLQSMYRYLLVHYTQGESGMTLTPMQYMMEVRSVLAQYKDVVIVGGTPDESNHYIWKPLLYNTAECVRDVVIDGGHIVVQPDGPFAAVFPPNAGIYDMTEFYMMDNPIVIPLRQGEDPYTIYAFDTAPTWTETPLLPVEAQPFDNGVRLTGYYLTTDRMYLRWELGENLNRDFFFYFGHFLDANGERIGQHDTGFWPPQYWCENDTLITWVYTPIPEGTAMLRIGMYQRHDNQITNSRLIDEWGNPFATWVDIPVEQPG